MLKTLCILDIHIQDLICEKINKHIHLINIQFASVCAKWRNYAYAKNCCKVYNSSSIKMWSVYVYLYPTSVHLGLHEIYMLRVLHSSLPPVIQGRGNKALWETVPTDAHTNIRNVWGAGEVAPLLGALTAFAKDLGSVLSTYMAAHNHP